MIANYLKLQLRQAARHKSHIGITLFGLVLGMTSCILIMLYVVDELSFDRWMPDQDRIYRYEATYFNANGDGQLTRRTPFRVKRDLIAYFPEIEHSTRIIGHVGTVVSEDAEYFEDVWFVDAEFPQVFGLTMLHGEAESGLADKASVLLSSSTARKYFGSEDVLDRTLTLDGQRSLRVAGVFQDVPETSHVDFSFVMLYDETDPLYNLGYSEAWSAIEGYTYMKLRPGVDADDIRASLPAFMESHVGEFTLTPGQRLSDLLTPHLRAVTDIHLDAGGRGNIKTPGSKQTLVTLSVIAVLVLLVACINYINLAGVRSFGRTREVFVRKATGAGKTQLILQLLLEPALVSLLALVLSVTLVELLLPAYNNVLGRMISSDYLMGIAPLATLLMMAFLIGLASGALPAFTLSSMSTATLKAGRASGGRALGYVQSALVTLQFAVAATLVVASLVIFLQQNFLQQRDTGFSPDNKLVIRNLTQREVQGKHELLATELEALSPVTGVTFSVATPGDATGQGFARSVTVPGYNEEGMPLFPKAVAANFFEVYGVTLAAGRLFSDAVAADEFYWSAQGTGPARRTTAVLNSTAVATLGFASATEALGKTMVMGGGEIEIIGVVEDFHFQSLRDALTPNLYIYSPAEYLTMTVAYAEGTDYAELVGAIGGVWKRIVPGFPLQLEIVAANIDAQYATDRRQFLLVTVFSTLTIIIACLGLYALASYATQRRTREIGIRKVHGALAGDITRLFLLQFTRPVLLANALALPCAIYLVKVYLDGYEYHVEPGPALFVLAALLTIGMAWGAVIFQTVSAAGARPVEALRYE